MTEHPTFIYSHRCIYHLIMRLLYGRHYQDRYRSLAGIIPERSTVVDLCCGDCYLFTHYLKSKQVDYLGLDISSSFIASAQKQGINVRQFDLRVDPIPVADIILMAGSLYQFIPNADQVIRRMLASARQKVLIAEPIQNLASLVDPFLAVVGRLTARPELGEDSHSINRFNKRSLLELFCSFENFDQYLIIPGGREIIGIFVRRVTPIQ